MGIADRIRKAPGQIWRSSLGAWGSTRSAGLIRLLFPMMIWSRYADRFLIYKLLDEPVLLAIGAGIFIGTSLMVVGLWSRFATALTATAMLSWYMYWGNVLGHHVPSGVRYMSYSLVALSFVDTGRSFSLDRYFAVRRAHKKGAVAPAEWGRVGGLKVYGIQLCIVYLFGAIDKSDMGWLRGDRMERYYVNFYGSSDFAPFFMSDYFFQALAIGTTALEWAMVIGLWFRPTRRWLMFAGIVLHGSFYVLLPVSTFSVWVWLAYIAIIPVASFHAFTETILGRGEERAKPVADSEPG